MLRQLGSTALFAGRFREAAGRALLLPRRRADQRSPLWQLRKRSYDLLSVASRYPSFPLLLEAYRECLRDVFDMPALIEILRAIEQRKLRVHVVETRKPSPFASSLLFSYVANFLYEGDAPLAERRAQALTIDQDQLRELLGEADLRELLDADAIAEVEEAAQCLAENYRARSADGIHDLCLRLGDLSREELARRVVSIRSLLDACRPAGSLAPTCWNCASPAKSGLIAAEDAARYRDGLGIPLPPGLAVALLEPVAHPVLELVRRYARTHGPFTLREAAERFALDSEAVENALRQLAHEGRVLEGGFRPGGLASRVVRCGDSAADSPQVAGQAAPRSGAGGAAHAGALPHALAGIAGAAAHRARRISTRCSMRSRACRARRCRRRCLKRRFCRRALPTTRPQGSIR